MPRESQEQASLTNQSNCPPAMPFVVELPAPGSPRRGRAVAVRCAVVAALAGLLIGLFVQFLLRTREAQRDFQPAKEEYVAALATYRQDPSEGNRQAALAAGQALKNTDHSRGAMGRWAFHIRAFWGGRNIYQTPPGKGIGDPLTGEKLKGTDSPRRPPMVLYDNPEELIWDDVFMHPNMPFVVVLLTPLALVPPMAAAVALCLLKIALLLMSTWMLAEVVNDGRRRMHDWVLALGVFFALPMLVSDFQHGNTNTFVLAAVAAHLWLFRRGHDLGAGALLALAVCFKLTPLLFAAYWLYQRNWRLLAGLAGGLSVMVVGVPLALLGPRQFEVLTGTWLANLVLPGLLGGAPYPIHINQSLTGVFDRLFMHGNIHFAPDDEIVAGKYEYINWVTLSPVVGRWVLAGLKLLIVLAMAWAVGWRRLPRDDGRRGLHYGLVAVGMMLLNQRTWDEHAAPMLATMLALWYGVVYGRAGRTARRWTLAGLALAAIPLWLVRETVFIALAGKDTGKLLADRANAYGATFACFLLCFILCAALLRGMRKAPPGQAYLAPPQPP